MPHAACLKLQAASFKPHAACRMPHASSCKPIDVFLSVDPVALSEVDG